MLVPTTVFRSRSGDKQLFDASCRRAHDLSRLLVVPGVEHAVQIIGVDLCLLVLRPRASMHGAVRESHNERTRNTLKHSTCSHKW